MLSEASGGHTEAAVKGALDASETHRAIQKLLENIHRGHAQVDRSPPAPVDDVLMLLHDRPALLRARDGLLPHSKDRSSLDVVFQARISSMIGVLNLFLDADLPYTWREALIVVAKAQGHGPTHARSIWSWVLDFV